MRVVRSRCLGRRRSSVRREAARVSRVGRPPKPEAHPSPRAGDLDERRLKVNAAACCFSRKRARSELRTLRGKGTKIVIRKNILIYTIYSITIVTQLIINNLWMKREHTLSGEGQANLN